MKEKILTAVVWTLISAGVLAEHHHGIEWAGNLSFFAMWILIVLSAIVLLLPSKDIFKTNNRSWTNRVMFFISCLILISAGWFVTSFALFFLWCITWVKREVYFAETKTEQ